MADQFNLQSETRAGSTLGRPQSTPSASNTDSASGKIQLVSSRSAAEHSVTDLSTNGKPATEKSLTSTGAVSLLDTITSQEDTAKNLAAELADFETMASGQTSIAQSDLESAELTTLKFSVTKAQKQRRLCTNLFYGLLTVCLLMTGYFYFQFEAGGELVGQAGLTLQDTQTQITQEQQQHDLLLYQLIRAQLESVVIEGSQYIESVAQSTPNQELRDSLESRLSRLVTHLNQLQNLQADDALEARVELSLALPSDLEASSIKGLLGSRYLHEELATTTNLTQVFSQPDTEFAKYLKELIVQLPTPEATVITLGLNRLRWSEIIVEIESITRAIDPNFGTPLQFIEYSNYNFNAATNRISLTGQVRTEDAGTFTLLADFIDAIEANPLFADVEMRSFAKNENSSDEQTLFADGYEAALNIEFSYIPPDFNTEEDA